MAKLRSAPFFTYSHPRQQQPGVARQKPARFEDERLPGIRERGRDGRRILLEIGRRLAAVSNAEPTAHVDMPELDALCFEPAHELGDAPQRFGDRRDAP